ncbi:response regulator [Massilia litorea]|uniref:Response regulator transcription factor n=1 Tax=Massilia litorea TaxID=2769491 RepID=A0A7L9UAP1_9BURK|nr:response regulator transcription factor [Massilia litorea]QOL52131.1 response regulator transcription factor [Massilia litorea]
MSTDRISILLVDDHRVVRNGIRLMLGTADDIEVVGEAETAQDALQFANEHDVDVVLVDINLPDKSGLDLIKRLRTLKPETAAVVLTAYPEETYALRAFRQGAAGYLNKNSSTDVIVAAVRKAAAGGRYLTPETMERFAGMLGGDRLGSHALLSDRELEVLKRLAEGESLVRIAGQLHLSPSTVTTYRARVLDKMGMKSNAELTRYAIEHGLLG